MMKLHLVFEVFFVNLCVIGLGLPISKETSAIFAGNVPKIIENQDPNLLESISAGTMLALEQCQNLFKWEKWNCPKEIFERHAKQPANKETAFTKAILAAGIVYSVTKNCSRGDIKHCGCDNRYESNNNHITSSQLYEDIQKYQENPTLITSNVLLRKNKNQTDFEWSWGGCSEDPTFASRVAKQLANNMENAVVGDAKDHIGIHNFRVGSEIIRHTMVKKCRCHGVSGSCSIQTCWMQTSPFPHIAKKLKEKYNRATRMSQDVIEKALTLGNTIQKREDVEKKKIPAPEHSLVYLEQSPDYCVANSTEGWPGTKGRSCSRNQLNTTTLAEKRSCRSLCRQCGHKVKKETRTVTKRCNCKFNWCCSVQCDTCVETVEEYYCQ